MSAVADILSDYESIREDQEAFYRDLHAHPELSHEEARTAGEVARRLTAWGFEVHSEDRCRRHPAKRRRPHRAPARRYGRAPGQGGHRRPVRE